MPLYEYSCSHCATTVEVMQKLSDPAPAACEKCGGALKKVISAPSFQFRGTGWYITDYARKGKDDGQRPKPSESSAKPDTADKASAPGESSEKPASETKAADTKATPAAATTAKAE